MAFHIFANPAVSTLAVHLVDYVTGVPLHPEHVRSAIAPAKQLAMAGREHCSVARMR